MKVIRLLIAPLLFIVFSCNDGYIDEISKVEPGADETAPVITMKFPAEGTTIKVAALLADIGIDFEVKDDIEVASIAVSVDGNAVTTLTEFPDYRRVIVEDLMYQGLANGNHTLTISATDIDGKTTTSTANFVKEPPYIPIYAGEVVYMSFDTEVGFKEMVTFSDPTIVGTPTLAGVGAAGGNAYKGAEASYLTLPTDRIDNSEITATFWMQVNNSPNRAGILVAGPPDPTPESPNKPNNRKAGFRFFREDAGGKQRFKLNVGDGTNDHWFDGGTAADVVPNTGEWVNFTFTISATQAVVYIDGEVASQGALAAPMSWAGCDVLSIMSGDPRFIGWDHFSDKSLMDELRIFNRALSAEEVQGIIEDRYEPKYDGEIFYMAFNGNHRDVLSGNEASVVGAPTFSADGIRGDSYAGAANSFLTFPTAGLTNNEFSAAFWLKANAVPDRAGVLVIGPPTADKPANEQNNRNSGFRFFREAAGAKQIFKLNVGTGTADTWLDGGSSAQVDPNEWVFFAFTISETTSVVYINGNVAAQATHTAIDWTDCDILSIMSGAPRFTEWGHGADQSLMDELRIFDKALTQAEVQAIMDGN